MKVLVIGASRGIGLEFVRQYLASGASVVAGHRKPEDGERLRTLGAVPIALDVRDAASIATLPARLPAQKIDVAILNAGVYGPRQGGAQAPSAADFDEVMHTNVRAPMQLLPVIAPLLAEGGRVAAISSRMGSIGSNSSAGGWLYRASKAALNAAMHAASFDPALRGRVVLAFHPGWVRTDMGGAGADIDVATSVAGLRAQIAAAMPAASGSFINYDGAAIAW
jgi:NAD(P)-dependent dehydrogenase (short-subunit alcohol dehydrogenase family)